MKHWIAAARPRTLPLALSGLIAGNALAITFGSNRIDIVLLSILTAVLLQVLSNFANDLGDAENGADNEGRIGPMRAVQSGEINKAQMKRAVMITAAIAFVCGLATLYHATNGQIGQKFYTFIGLGIGCILAALFYTWGKKPYGYAGLGDLSVFLFFGPVAVIGSFLLHFDSVNPVIYFPAVAIGLFSVAVLNLNNMRDLENDAKAGKKTIPVRKGLAFARNYQLLLIGNGCALFLGSVITFAPHKPLVLLTLIPIAFQFVGIKRILAVTKPEGYDPFLKRVALATFAIALIYSIGIVI